MVFRKSTTYHIDELALSDFQKKHIDTMRWLVSQKRCDIGTGRTQLLATVYIERALENPGIKIKVFDHDTEIKGLILDRVRKLVKENDLPIEFRLSDQTISYREQV